MDARVRRRVNRIVRALKPYDPERVILFGSAARGDTNRCSDIDIAIIKETNACFLDRLAEVYDLIQPDFALDVLVYTPNEFAEMQTRANPFIADIVREGIVVYARAGTRHKPLNPLHRSRGMPKGQAEQSGQRWLQQAQSDLAAAKWNEQGGFYSVACFWSQQAAERALKAYLYSRGKRRVRGHSVLELAKECARLDEDFKPLVTQVAFLDRLYIATRYPNGLPDGVPAQVYRVDEARTAIQLAETTVTLVERKISSE